MMEKVELKELEENDVTQSYVDWMNDLEVTRYTEQRFVLHTLDGVKSFVREKRLSENNYLFGIYLDKVHAGNIKLGPINYIHKIADISYFIGEKKFWGSGLTTKAIGMVIKIAFERFNLEKVCAGSYDLNIASQRALLKNGFQQEGIRKKHVLFEGKRIDSINFGLTKDKWQNDQTK